MRKLVGRTLLILAATLPLTVLSVNAQNIYDEDIATYAQELDYRIEQGRGSISDAQYRNLRDLYNKIDFIRRQYTNRKLGTTERTNIMASLMNLDKELSNNLHDTQNSHWQDWDANSRTWKRNWWSNVSKNYNYNDEIDSYQRQLQNRIDRGRSSGKITAREYHNLMTKYNQIDSLQRNYRRGGYSYSERNSLMNSLAQLDRDVTAQLKDNDRSHFNQWDNDKHTWNREWWRTSNSDDDDRGRGRGWGRSKGNRDRDND